MNISDCLKEIRAYTAAHVELQNAHHFLFDLPVGPQLPSRCAAVVMGLNPRETAYQRQRWPVTAQMRAAGKIFEESREHDFMHPEPRDWTKLIVDFCGTDNVVQTEAFFWSSENVGDDFMARFGTAAKQSPNHLKFCKLMNGHLFDEYSVGAVVCPGFEFREIAIQQYGLTLKNKVARFHPKIRGSLIEEYSDGERSWVFTLHWKSGRGLTGALNPTSPTVGPAAPVNDERALLRSYIQEVIAAALPRPQRK